MAVRILPVDYFKEKPEIQELPTTEIPEQQVEIQTIPDWVPIIVGICVVGAFVVSIYAISKIK